MGTEAVTRDIKSLEIDTRHIGFHKQSHHYKLFDLPVKGLEDQTYYNNCYCNEYDALKRRHLLEDLEDSFRDPVLNACWDEVTNEYVQHMKQLMAENGGYRPYSFEKTVKTYKGSNKRRYQNAFYNIVNKRITFGDLASRLTCFVKTEKWPVTKIEAGKPPRGIQFRTYEYGLAFKSVVQPIVDLTKIDTPDKHINLRTTFTKNLTPSECARAMKDAWDKHTFPAALCLDHSKFDGHYSYKLLDEERMRAMKISGCRKSSLLSRLYSLQKHNKGRTQGGIMYKIFGKRCSGEFTTSHGNCESNYLMIRAVCKRLGIVKIDIFVNGDDSVVVGDYQDMLKMSEAMHMFRNFNMETELDRLVTTFTLISYCQCQPIETLNGWTLIRHPRRTMERIRYTDKNWGNALPRFLSSLALCELSCNQGVPILQPLSELLLAKANFARPFDTRHVEHFNTSNTIKTIEITEKSRSDFAEAFDISIGEQIMIEKSLLDEIVKYNPGISSDNYKIYLTRYSDYHKTI